MPDTPGQDEILLLRGIAHGDRNAFTSLYSQYLDQVYRYVFLFTKSEAITEEIVQEVFIRIWERREQLERVLSFRAYLFRAARNRVVDFVRHRQVEDRTMAGYLAGKNTLTPETPGEAFDYKAYYLLVQKAMEDLSPQRQLIFRLNTEKGMSHDEIAAELNISKSAVKKQFYEAIDHVRTYLSQHGELSFALILLASTQ